MSGKTLRQVANAVIEIEKAWDEGAEIDAAIDGGEFSGPAAARSCAKEVLNYCQQEGYSVIDVQNEIAKIEAEEDDQQ